MVLALCVALVYHAVLRHIGMKWPWTSFLSEPEDRFNDWLNSVAQAASGDPYFFHGTKALAAYFPAAYLIFDVAKGLHRVGSTILFLAMSTCLGVVAAFTIASSRAERSTGHSNLQVFLLLLLCIACAYPVWFSVERGNLDLCVASACVIFVATLGGRFQSIGLAALAIAISVKGYPAVFLSLLVVKRGYWQVVWCLAGVAVISLIGLLTFNSSIENSLVGLRTNLQLFYDVYVVGDGSLFASSDPYNAIRIGAHYFAAKYGPPPAIGAPPLIISLSVKILRVYGILSSAFALISVFFVLVIPASAWRRVTAVCLVAILFPNVANDYKLCCLLPGLLLLLLSYQGSRRERIALGLFFLLMIPKSYFFIKGYTVSMLVNPVLLLALAWTTLAERAAWRSGWRLLRYRVVWYIDALPAGQMTTEWINGGRRPRFLARPHETLSLL